MTHDQPADAGYVNAVVTVPATELSAFYRHVARFFEDREGEELFGSVDDDPRGRSAHS